MARKKMFMQFETKDEYEKFFHDIFKEGKGEGIKEGIAYALSLMLDARDKLCELDAQVSINAAHMQSGRHAKEFEQRQKTYAAIREQAVKDYLETIKED